MSSNTEIIKELYRSFREKDHESFKQICDEGIVWRQSPGFPKGSNCFGAQEVIDNIFKSFDNSWSDWNFIIDNYYDAGETNSKVTATSYRL